MEERNRTTSGARSAGARRTSSGSSGRGAAEFASPSSAGSAGVAGTSDTTRGDAGNGEQSHRGFADRIRDGASAQLSSQKDRATDGLGSIAQAVRQSTQQLREQNHDTVAQYVEQAADQIARFSDRLREKDLGELLGDAQRLARRQPALFIGSAFALGLLSARFFKSSPEPASSQDWRRHEPFDRSGAREPFGSMPSGASGSGLTPATETFNG